MSKNRRGGPGVVGLAMAALATMLLTVLAACAGGSAAAESVSKLELVAAADAAGPIALGGFGPVVMELGPSSLSGTTPCTTFAARVGGSDDQLKLDTMRGRTFTCDAAAQRWDARVLTAMWQAETLRVDTQPGGGHVVLSGPGGIRLDFAPAPVVDAGHVMGTRWEIAAWYSFGAAATPTTGAWVQISDGEVTGSTGCRDFTGTATADPQGAVMATVIPVGECTDDTLASQDRRILGAFDEPLEFLGTSTVALAVGGWRGLVVSAQGF